MAEIAEQKAELSSNFLRASTLQASRMRVTMSINLLNVTALDWIGFGFGFGLDYGSIWRQLAATAATRRNLSTACRHLTAEEQKKALRRYKAFSFG